MHTSMALDVFFDNLCISWFTFMSSSSNKKQHSLCIQSWTGSKFLGTWQILKRLLQFRELMYISYNIYTDKAQ